MVFCFVLFFLWQPDVTKTILTQDEEIREMAKCDKDSRVSY